MKHEAKRGCPHGTALVVVLACMTSRLAWPGACIHRTPQSFATHRAFSPFPLHREVRICEALKLPEMKPLFHSSCATPHSPHSNHPMPQTSSFLARFPAPWTEGCDLLNPPNVWGVSLRPNAPLHPAPSPSSSPTHSLTALAFRHSLGLPRPERRFRSSTGWTFQRSSWRSPAGHRSELRRPGEVRAGPASGWAVAVTLETKNEHVQEAFGP